MANILHVAEATSTSTLLASISEASHGTVVAAYTQSAGRGQRGNSWESEPGKNLTFSLLLRPRKIEAARQFEISQLVAIAIVRILSRHLASDKVRIKWPNDIYWEDKKICGILIENTLNGSGIERSIAGIGINVNQARFLSDAPNPVSMLNISGHEYPLDTLLKDFSDQIINSFDAYEANPDPEALGREYASMLWRAEGYWPYHDMIKDEPISARIHAVAPSGMLTLETADGEFRTFAFKEVAALIGR